MSLKKIEALFSTLFGESSSLNSDLAGLGLSKTQIASLVLSIYTPDYLVFKKTLDTYLSITEHPELYALFTGLNRLFHANNIHEEKNALSKITAAFPDIDVLGIEGFHGSIYKKPILEWTHQLIDGLDFTLDDEEQVRLKAEVTDLIQTLFPEAIIPELSVPQLLLLRNNVDKLKEYQKHKVSIEKILSLDVKVMQLTLLVDNMSMWRILCKWYHEGAYASLLNQIIENINYDSNSFHIFCSETMSNAFRNRGQQAYFEVLKIFVDGDYPETLIEKISRDYHSSKFICLRTLGYLLKNSPEKYYQIVKGHPLLEHIVKTPETDGYFETDAYFSFCKNNSTLTISNLQTEATGLFASKLRFPVQTLIDLYNANPETFHQLISIENYRFLCQLPTSPRELLHLITDKQDFLDFLKKSDIKFLLSTIEGGYPAIKDFYQTTLRDTFSALMSEATLKPKDISSRIMKKPERWLREDETVQLKFSRIHINLMKQIHETDPSLYYSLNQNGELSALVIKHPSFFEEILSSGHCSAFLTKINGAQSIQLAWILRNNLGWSFEKLMEYSEAIQSISETVILDLIFTDSFEITNLEKLIESLRTSNTKRIKSFFADEDHSKKGIPIKTWKKYITSAEPKFDPPLHLLIDQVNSLSSMDFTSATDSIKSAFTANNPIKYALWRQDEIDLTLRAIKQWDPQEKKYEYKYYRDNLDKKSCLWSSLYCRIMEVGPLEASRLIKSTCDFYFKEETSSNLEQSLVFLHDLDKHIPAKSFAFIACQSGIPIQQAGELIDDEESNRYYNDYSYTLYDEVFGYSAPAYLYKRSFIKSIKAIEKATFESNGKIPFFGKPKHAMMIFKSEDYSFLDHCIENNWLNVIDYYYVNGSRFPKPSTPLTHDATLELRYGWTLYEIGFIRKLLSYAPEEIDQEMLNRHIQSLIEATQPPFDLSKVANATKLKKDLYDLNATLIERKLVESAKQLNTALVQVIYQDKIDPTKLSTDTNKAPELTDDLSVASTLLFLAYYLTLPFRAVYNFFNPTPPFSTPKERALLLADSELGVTHLMMSTDATHLKALVNNALQDLSLTLEAPASSSQASLDNQPRLQQKLSEMVCQLIAIELAGKESSGLTAIELKNLIDGTPELDRYLAQSFSHMAAKTSCSKTHFNQADAAALDTVVQFFNEWHASPPAEPLQTRRTEGVARRPALVHADPTVTDAQLAAGQAAEATPPRTLKAR